MQLSHLRVQTREGVCRITLGGGLMTAGAARELSGVAAEVVEDRSVRAVVIDSSGPDFCSGLAEGFDPLERGANPTIALADIRVPVVAMLRGEVMSVGLEIALTADFRLASPDAVLGLPDVGEGRLPSWGGTQRLTRTIGAAEALRMLLLCQPVSAARALEVGLVHEVVSDPASRCDELLAQWAARSPLALEYAKEAVLAGSELRMREGLGLEADLNTLLQVSADRAEGISAFLEKRSPTFTGR
ncbi:MAG: enoyl-CoA hydratase/isomerase family protein [Microbacteriaceae bacterium]